MINSAIGKWISMTCCACFTKNTAFMWNGCKVAPHSLHDDFSGHLRVNRTEVRISSALPKVKENFSSVSSTLDLNVFGSSVLTTVWGISSRLVHVTVVPTGTVSVTG